MNIENMYVHMFEEFEWSSRGRWFKGYGKFYPNEQLYKYKRMTSGKDFYIQGMFEFDDEKTEKYLAKLFLTWKNENWELKKFIVYDYVMNYLPYPHGYISTYKKIKHLLVIK